MIRSIHMPQASAVGLFCGVVACLFSLACTAAQAQEQSDVDIAGVWSVVAQTDDGQHSSTWTIVKSGDGYAGSYVGDRQEEREFSSVSLEGNQLKLEIPVDIQGAELLITVDSKVDGKKLAGNWAASRDGEELASGSLVATKQASRTSAEFDGSTIESFRGYATEEVGAGWSMTDGVLHFDGNRCGDLVTKAEFGDFELEFDWKISQAGNSGVMYRVGLGDKKPYFTGPEYQILDDDKHKDGKLESHRAGALYALYVPQNKTLKPVGQWNSTRIVLNGNRVEHWLNGNKVVSAELGSDDWNERVGASKFKKWEKFGKLAKGHIAFQDHGDPVWYRNIRIKSLEDATDSDVAEPAKVSLQGDNKVNVMLGDELFTTFDHKTYDKPILYPIYAPGQIGMTRDWPMKKDTKGESHDHPHHKSMWISHEIGGVDFWAEKGGAVKTTSIETSFADTPANVFRATSSWVTKGDGKTLLTDETTCWFGGDNKSRWINCMIKYRATHGDVEFDDTKEGLFAIRTHPDLRLKAKPKAGVAEVFGKAINSQGETGKDVWGKPAKWMLYYGPIDGNPVSIAMYDHPTNIRHPTTWHARDYGLVTANPFGMHHFLGKEKGTGAFKVKDGDALELRYRIEFFNGIVTPEAVEAKFQAFAKEALPTLVSIKSRR